MLELSLLELCCLVVFLPWPLNKKKDYTQKIVKQEFLLTPTKLIQEEMKRRAFELSYVGVEKDTYAIVYHKMGDFSVVLSTVNPVQKYSCNKDGYYEFHSTITNILKILGEGYTFQKHDIFSKKKYKGKESKDYLSKKYFEHFNGRVYNDTTSYITITKTINRSAFFQFNQKDFDVFIKNITKIISLLIGAGFDARALEENEIQIFIKRYLSFDFVNDSFSIRNFKITPEHIEFGNNILKSMSIIDIDEVNFPDTIKPYSNLNIGYEFPADIMSFLDSVPDCSCVVYHQVISIPFQKKEIIKLEGKKKKHSGIPDPANDLCVQDIDNVLGLIARSNELLVYAHYNILLFGSPFAVDNATNYLESNLFNFGLIPSNNSYNQKELFISSFPGHTYDIKNYDKFFITSDPAVALMYKESPLLSEDSSFQIFLTDRQGVPVAIDTSDLPMEKGRINNRNKFVLGPSGSGKSFFMNTLVKQYFEQETDIILVDTGHSYSGLCQYFNGKYITYTEDKPITMNPFLLSKKEYNEEKRDFLKSLVGLLWKGADGTLNQVEDSVLINIVSDYYHEHFSGRIKKEDLNFNSFYEYSIEKMKSIREDEAIKIDVEGYKFILKKFYKGGEYDQILNSSVDSSLFDEKFIVFEIDNIKDNKILFPITTIIIMDVFLQKMRHKNNRKALIIEEAWKAIASPMMASYILYVYKTVRKYWGEAVVVTQELEDIISNDIVKNSIINNSDTIILLDQAKFKESYDDVASLLSLNDIEQKKIFTINRLDNKENRNRFKEVYIKRGISGEVYGVEVSFEEYLTYTTEKREKAAIAVYLEMYNSYNESIDRFVNDFKESGLNLTLFCNQVSKNKDSLIQEVNHQLKK